MPTYRVQPGDRLSTIATLLGIPAQAIVEANPRKQTRRLFSGVRVFKSLQGGEDLALPEAPGELGASDGDTRDFGEHTLTQRSGEPEDLNDIERMMWRLWTRRPAIAQKDAERGDPLALRFVADSLRGEPQALAGGPPYQQPVFEGADCQPGYVRDAFGACVLEDEGPQPGDQDWQGGDYDVDTSAEATSQVPLPPEELALLPPCPPGMTRDIFAVCVEQSKGRPT